MYLKECFGVVIAGFEFESTRETGLHIDAIDCHVSIIGLSPRLIVNDTITNIRIAKCGNVTFSDLFISELVCPENGYVIDLDDTYANKVTFVNSIIRGINRGIEKCNYVGGNRGNRLKNSCYYELMTTNATMTISNPTFANNITIDNKNVEGIKLDASPCIDLSGYSDGEIIKISNIRSVPFSIATSLVNRFEMPSGLSSLTFEPYSTKEFIVTGGYLKPFDDNIRYFELKSTTVSNTISSCQKIIAVDNLNVPNLTMNATPLVNIKNYKNGDIVEFRNLRATPFDIAVKFANGVEKTIDDEFVRCYGYGIVRFIVNGNTLRLCETYGNGKYKFTLSSESTSNTISTTEKVIVVDNLNVPNLSMSGTPVFDISKFEDGDIVEVRNLRATPFKITTTIDNGFESVSGVQEVTINGYSCERFIVNGTTMRIGK